MDCWCEYFFPNPIFLGVLLLFILYYYGKSNYGYWNSQGVENVTPKYPFFGNFFETMFSIRPFHEVQLSLYNTFKGKSFGGVYNFRKPELFVVNPELVVTILIKDFGNFYNRNNKRDPQLDPLLNSLLNFDDEKWKYLRNKLTPAFTSGKLKYMHQHLLDGSDILVKHMEKFAMENRKPFETKEIMSNFTIDVIASCAFGLNTDVLNQPDSPLRKIALRIFQLTFLNRLRRSIRGPYPWVLRLLHWKHMPKEMENFFIGTIKELAEYREKNNIVRQDFLHMMNEIKKKDTQILQNGSATNEERLVIMDDKLMAANSLIFFLAGFETTSATLSYALFELSRNQDIQEKLYEEIVSVVKKYNGVPTYDAVKEMSYLSQVLNETLRLYPPAPATTRISKYSYKLPNSSLVIPKGTSVHIPIYSLQHDPEYFPEPYKFLPERFAKENKDKIRKGTFLPFGDGPRICIGMRFAKVEAKMALLKILLTYKVLPSKKTQLPLKYNSKTIFLVPIGGLWVEIEKRNV